MFASARSLAGTPACGLRFPGGVLGARTVLRWHRAAEEGCRMLLRGRREQCRALDGLLADVRAGRSRVLIVRGERC